MGGKPGDWLFVLDPLFRGLSFRRCGYVLPPFGFSLRVDEVLRGPPCGSKGEPDAQVLSFLGIEIDTNDILFHLPQDRVSVVFAYVPWSHANAILTGIVGF